MAIAQATAPVGVMGTTRKNKPGFPQRFIDAKQLDTQFTYVSCSIEVVDHCLCFLWQDNAPVIGITTAFSIQEGPKDYVIIENGFSASVTLRLSIVGVL
jgi:hypothetical protein